MTETVFGCDKCLAVFRVHGTSNKTKVLILEHSKWSAGWPCPRCGGALHIPSVTRQDLSQFATNIVELSPTQFFRALCGFGLPDEITCDVEVVRSLLLANAVVQAQLRVTASDRCVLDSLTLQNGRIIHLAASPDGPCVFKITRSCDARNNHPAVSACATNT